jgi:hypothetical protein
VVEALVVDVDEVNAQFLPFQKVSLDGDPEPMVINLSKVSVKFEANPSASIVKSSGPDHILSMLIAILERDCV